MVLLEFIFQHDLIYRFQKSIGIVSLALFAVLLLRPRLRGAVDSLLSRWLPGKSGPMGSGGIACGALLFLLLLPLARHYAFQSRNYDLTEFANVAYNIFHGNGFYFSMERMNLLGGHFEPLLAPMSAVLWIWENAASFLILQSGMLFIAGLGVYRLTLRITDHPTWSFLIAAMYFFCPQTHEINRYDFHPESITPALVIWGLYWLHSGRTILMILAIAVLMLVKEDMPMVAFLIGGYLVFHRPRRPVLGAALAATAVIAFGVILWLIMPWFRQGAPPMDIQISRYQHLGASWGEVLKTLASDPIRIAVGVIAQPLVWKTAYRMIWPFLLFPLAAGWTLLLPLLAWAPHAISIYPPQIGLVAQYGAGVLPLLVLAAVTGLKHALQFAPRIQGHIGLALREPSLSIVFLAIVALSAFNVKRYTSPIDPTHRRAIVAAVQAVPPHVTVSAQYHLGPHVAMRRSVYEFPTLNDAEVVLLDREGPIWPLQSLAEFDAELSSLTSKGNFVSIFEQDGVIVLQRFHPPQELEQVVR